MILNLLFSIALAQEPDPYSVRGVRPEILNSSDDFLNARVSKSTYYQLLTKWNQLGWSNEEKDIVVDTLQKSFDDSQEKNSWLCNLKPNLYCSKKIYFTMIQWPEYLDKYHTLIFAGQPYPKHEWNSLVLNGKNRYIFVSTDYAPIEHFGEPHNIRFPDRPQELNQVNKSTKQPNFYEKHKSKIWWTVGGVLIASGIFSLAGKKIVITQLGFL